ncbi:MAG TPA: class I SAM-dependent methyltransferase [Nitrospirales bacterium]|nr:class I SAM-dependent methyltransferase [Nitrospirales bacterium]
MLGLLGRHFPRGGTLLVAGSGTGREALHLAREGYGVTGFDLVPVMVDASRRNATKMGIDAEFIVGDMFTLDLKGRVFDGAYITPLVYSFVSGRSRRVECLRRLGKHLKPGGEVVYSPHLMRHPRNVLRAALLWCLRRARGCSSNEFGDWYTWFLTPKGDLGKAFSRRFLVRQVVREARDAGFGHISREAMAHFVAGDFEA